ncbi:hypothetical protein PR048_022801 [Dryococelus australis]|uniref:Major facilitator superfamily (MFS) profile domain-containing protein n=1 Tax=Dryococelus australis TaxID=614101 RepID=A0ABQ9GSD0_9NEOP|nr:hypothetical protein PR048_022801 [Dryococelus australis]
MTSSSQQPGMTPSKELVAAGKTVGWRWRQYLAAILVNIVSVALGTGYGWVAPMLPLLQSEDSPIGIPPISDDEASWIASIAMLSRLVSIPAYMYAHDRLGRKMTSYLTAIPYIASWTMFLCANSVTLLFCARTPQDIILVLYALMICRVAAYITFKSPADLKFVSCAHVELLPACFHADVSNGLVPNTTEDRRHSSANHMAESTFLHEAQFTKRFLLGVASGGTCLLVPSYLSDIAEDDIKGQLGILYAMSIDVGLTLGYAMGHYMSYTAFNACCLLLPIFFAAAMFWLPESPVFLMTEGKVEEARMALRWLRNGQETEAEMDRLRARADDTLQKRYKKLTISDITERSMIRGILINLSLAVIRYLCGMNALISYTVIIFQEAGSTIEPHICTIATGLLFVFGSLFSSFVVERSGRRPLLIYSTILLAVSLITLGTYFYLKYLGWDLVYVGWIPLVCLCLYNMLHGIALGPLPSAIANETVTVHARGAVQSLCNIAGSLVSFLVIMTYIPLSNTVGHHGCFWLYAGVCIIGAIIMFLTVPETKNRSMEDVVEQLKSDHYIKSVLQKKKDSDIVTKVIA